MYEATSEEDCEPERELDSDEILEDEDDWGGNYVEKLCDKEQEARCSRPSFVPERYVEKPTAKRKIKFPPPFIRKSTFCSFFEKLKKVDFLMNGGKLNSSLFLLFD